MKRNKVEYIHECSQCHRRIKYKSKMFYDKAVAEHRLCKKCKLNEWIEATRAKIVVNATACQVMDELNKRGYNFQHAKNGGQVFIKTYINPFGIFLEGYDSKHKIVFEWGDLKGQEDLERQTAIFRHFTHWDKVGIRFFRFSESQQTIYEVFRSDKDKQESLDNKLLSKRWTNESEGQRQSRNETESIGDCECKA